MGDAPLRHADPPDPGAFLDLPDYSTNLRDAWRVVARLDGQWTLSGQEGIGWEATFYSSTGGVDAKIVHVTATGDTAPQAICLAALAAAAK